MAVQFRHEGLAEAHDLAIRTAARVEIGPALAATDRQPGQRVLEDLFKTQELDDAEVDRGMESDSPFVGSKRGIELHPESAVDLDLTIVIDPGDRSAEPTSELQSLMRISYAVFCLKKKKHYSIEKQSTLSKLNYY